MNKAGPQTVDSNQIALKQLYAVRPAWTRVVSAAQAVGLGSHCLLHAGPPFADRSQPSAPILASAALCCVYEGWAADIGSARAMILDGRVALHPAQEYDVVTPLAAVVSPTTFLVEISDLNTDSHCWSLLPSGAGPQIRFGTADLAILERLRFRDQELARALQPWLQGRSIELIALAQAGLRAGDDLHAQTAGATAALLQQLLEGQAPQVVTEVVETAPLFFLTLWMAACHLMLKATVGAGAPSLVIGLAGNGQEVGVRLSGAPEKWLTRAARRPDGPRLKELDALAAPMLGDSGVIDAAGFGVQAWGHAQGVRELMLPWLPEGWASESGCMVGQHPAFTEFSLRTGLDAGLAQQQATPPMVALAMLDSTAEHGLLGRGVCLTDPALYTLPGQGQPSVNQPAILAEVNRAVDDYERALTGNDLAELDRLFWNSPHTLRYGAGEHLYGYAAIAAFRRARADSSQLARHIIERSVTTFGNEFAVANIVFQRPGNVRLGRQTQSWVCIEREWRIVAAHVSWATS
ncbi:oxalurate catabolism protein HpxZ [Halopseudomonas pelagia]|uniref:oxalurate catabolism protein HpxZ n=1 Tax=Halopseudomonas pelagia TaxID=553151 RepID=UPI0003A49E3B|nr:oxalurate catabolism protein HpxZ [Halopseudomonas pelagia]